MSAERPLVGGGKPSRLYVSMTVILVVVTIEFLLMLTGGFHFISRSGGNGWIDAVALGLGLLVAIGAFFAVATGWTKFNDRDQLLVGAAAVAGPPIAWAIAWFALSLLAGVLVVIVVVGVLAFAAWAVLG